MRSPCSKSPNTVKSISSSMDFLPQVHINTCRPSLSTIWQNSPNKNDHTQIIIAQNAWTIFFWGGGWGCELKILQVYITFKQILKLWILWNSAISNNICILIRSLATNLCILRSVIFTLSMKINAHKYQWNYSIANFILIGKWKYEARCNHTAIVYQYIATFCSIMYNSNWYSWPLSNYSNYQLWW